MQRSIRHRLARFVTPAFVGLVALGAGPAAHALDGPASAALPADAHCVMVVDKANSKPGKPVYAIKGSEFTAKSTYSIIGIKRGGGGGPVSDQGTIFSGKLPPGNYGVSTKEEGTVLCGSTPKAPNKDWRYTKGYATAYEAITDDCDADPPANFNKQNPSWQQGYRDGAAAAKEDRCS